MLFKNMLIRDMKKYKFAQIVSQSLIDTFVFLCASYSRKDIQ